MKNISKIIIILSLILLVTACFGDKEIEVEETIEEPVQEPIQREITQETEEYLERYPTIEVDNKTMFLIAPPPPKNEIEVINGRTFKYQRELRVWRTELQKGNELLNMSFRYNPNEVRNIPSDGDLSKTFDLKNIYITFDPNKDSMEHLVIVGNELSMHLAASFKRNPKPACTGEHPDCPEIITCENRDKAVIFLDNNPGPQITLDNNCLIITGQGEDIIKAAEKMIFLWYGFYN